MSLADEIRAFTYEQFVKPALAEMGFANVSCGEVHSAMKFTDRVPAVCSAIGSKIFEAEYGLRMVQRLGRPVSTRTTFVYEATDPTAVNSMPPEQREALKWFESHAGETPTWSDLAIGGLRLAIMPKGIYRPQGWRHVLSVKVMPGGRYADEESVSDDGGLRLQYHQEEPRNADPLRYFDLPPS